MNESMCRVQRGSFVYYTCRRIPVRHAFTTKFGGVSTRRVRKSEFRLQPR